MKFVIGILLIISLVNLKCVSQTDITNFESAATTPVNQVRTNLSYGAYLISYKEHTDRIFNQTSLSVGFGIHEQFELKLGYSHIHYDQMDNLYLIQLTPKFCGKTDLLSFKANLGIFIEKQDPRYSDKKYETFYRVSPRFLITFISTRHFDLTFAPAFDIMFGENTGNDGPIVFLGCTLGFGFSSNMDVWALRPELGLMRGLSEGFDNGVVWTPGLGLVVTF